MRGDGTGITHTPSGLIGPPADGLGSPGCFLFQTHTEADEAIRLLAHAGIDMAQLSLVGKGCCSEEHPVGFYTAADRIKDWWRNGAFWGGIWGLLLAPVVFMLPGLNVAAKGGPLAVALVGAVEGAIVMGSLSALGAALSQIGVPREHVIQYASLVRVDKYLLVVQGDITEQERVRSLLMGRTSSPGG